MSKTVYVWRIWCETDSRYEFWKLYDTDPSPTTCPVNTAHTVNLNDVTLRNIINQSQVTIKEEDVPTGGKWAAQSHWFYGATGGVSGPSETVTQITWAHDVSVFNVQYRSREENERDQAHLYVETKDAGFGVGVIGTITADAPTGATGITVSQTIIDNILAADWIALTDGINTTDYIQICSVKKEPRMLELTAPMPYFFSAASPTFVKFRRYVMRNYNLGPPNLYQLGNGKSVAYINYDSTKSKELFAYIERLE